MTERYKKAYWAALTNAATMIKSHGEEGSDHSTDEFTEEEYNRAKKKVYKMLELKADKIRFKHTTN